MRPHLNLHRYTSFLPSSLSERCDLLLASADLAFQLLDPPLSDALFLHTSPPTILSMAPLKLLFILKISLVSYLKRGEKKSFLDCVAHFLCLPILYPIHFSLFTTLLCYTYYHQWSYFSNHFQL